MCDNLCQDKKEVVVQTGTELYSIVPLSEKLQRIDKEFDEKRATMSLLDRARFEEKMLSYQRDTDRRMKEELHNEVLRFKETTLLKMRLEEREKLEMEFDSKRKELEFEYRNKMATVLARERQSFEQMTRLQEVNERESYMRRQSMLEEIDKIRQREADMRRQEEQWERERRLLHERVQSKTEDLSQKERDLKLQEMQLQERMQKEIQKIKAMEESKYMQRWKDLEAMEARLREDQRIHEEHKASTTKLRDEMLKRQQLFDEMEVVQYPLLKEENLTLKKELELVKERLGELRQDYEEEKTKYERILKERSAPTLEEKMLRKDLDSTKDTLHREQELWEEQKRNLQKRLVDEANNSKTLLRRYEEQNEQFRDLQRELNDLRGLLSSGDGGGGAGRSSRSLRTPRSTRRFFYPIGRRGEDEPGGGVFMDNSGHLMETSLPMLKDAPHQQHFDNDGPDDGGSSVEWEDMLRDSKHRLQGLEEETQNLQHVYQDFQLRQLHPELHEEKQVEKGNIAVHVHYEPANTRQFQTMKPTVPTMPAPVYHPLPLVGSQLQTYSKAAPGRDRTDPGRTVPQNVPASNTDGSPGQSSHGKASRGAFVGNRFQEDNRQQSTVVTFDIPEDPKPVQMMPFVDRSSSYPIGNQPDLGWKRGAEPTTDAGATSRDVGSTEQQLGPQESRGFDTEDYINPDDTTPGGALSTSEDIVLDASGQGPPLPHDDADKHFDSTEEEEEEEEEEASSTEPSKASSSNAGPPAAAAQVVVRPSKEEAAAEEDKDIDPVMLKYMQRVKAERELRQAQQREQASKTRPFGDRSESSSSTNKRISGASKGSDNDETKNEEDDDNFW